jgi:hypothetical protein
MCVFFFTYLICCKVIDCTIKMRHTRLLSVSRVADSPYMGGYCLHSSTIGKFAIPVSRSNPIVNPDKKCVWKLNF